MTSRITISVAYNAPHHVVIKGGPTGGTLNMKPGDTLAVDLIDGYEYSIGQGAKFAPIGPLPESIHGKPVLRGV